MMHPVTCMFTHINRISVFWMLATMPHCNINLAIQTFEYNV